MPAPVPPYLLPPEQRFAYIMAALARAMAEQANARRFAGPLVVLICWGGTAHGIGCAKMRSLS